MRHLASLALTGLVLAAACSGSGKGTCGTGVICGVVDGGYDGGAAAFTITTLPTRGTDADFTSPSFAVGLSNDGRIGIAYYWDPSPTNRELDYLEIAADGTTQTTYIDTVQQVKGVTMAFDLGGTPNVAYLGQDPADPPPINDAGVVFWTQSNLAVATIHSFVDGGVQHTYPAHMSSDVSFPSDPLVATSGNVVGLFPAMVAVDAGLVVAYRDIHFGQFLTDYSKSNWNAAVGSPAGNWVDTRIQIGTDTSLEPHGGLGALAKGVVGPAGIGMLCSGEANNDATPTDVVFALGVDGGWQDQQVVESVNNAGAAGASLASDPMVGYGVAWVEMDPPASTAGASILNYTSSVSGLSWSSPEQVFGSGAGGWEPSLAYDSNDLANIAFYVCSEEAGQDSCPAAQEGLWLTTRRSAGNWEQQLIDPAGGRLPILHYDASGNMILVYRDVLTGDLKMARSTSAP